MNMPKTYADAINKGYTISFYSWQRGYISRKSIDATRPVKVAGGRRRGMLYVVFPSFDSSQYCLRAYLVKEA